MTPAATPPAQPATARPWLDLVKAVALIWICFGHVSEQLWGFPLLGNPGADWPPLADRIAQLQPLPIEGPSDWIWNAWRYVGWLGDLGVPLFLIASGFGLTWGLLQRDTPSVLPWGPFLRRRALRLYPQWVLAHFLFAIPAFLLGTATWLVEPRFALSLLGVRATPSLLYYISPAWWYVGLLLQLYAVYPLLWMGLRRWGGLRLSFWIGGGAVVLRFAGLWVTAEVAPQYLDAWSRGAICISRLPEFVLGIAFAWWLNQSPTGLRLLTRSVTLCGAAVLMVTGIAASLTLSGMAVAPALSGAGLFALLAGLGARFAWHGPMIRWVAQHSLSLFLVHHPLVLWLIPKSPGTPGALAGRIAAVAVLTIAGSLLLEFIAAHFTRRLRDRLGRRSLLRWGCLCAATSIAAAVGTELALRRYDPQEVLGWGERAALRADPDVDWNLKPSRATRLRWESYDYVVHSNRLGFPGPDYEEQRKAPRGLRLLVTGDAFSSAEGVPTPQSWPRRLESQLRYRLPRTPIEVWNFGITGHGPNQYAKVVAKFAPRCSPDLILIGMFVNDFRDAVTTREAFHRSIGFGRSDPETMMGIAQLPHLRAFLRLRLGRWRDEWLRGVPFSHGYYIGNFPALERSWTDFADARAAVTDRFRAIAEVAGRLGAPVVLVMFPAPVQIASRFELDYYPQHVRLDDAKRFDADRPQREAAAIADELGFAFYDLRATLQTTQPCPFQPGNMHLLPHGHAAVARFVADQLLGDRMLPQ